MDEGLLVGVRGAGAVWGITLNDGVDVVAVRDALLAEGVIIRPIPPHMSMCPPLVITDEQIDTMVSALRNVLIATR
jgi:adenosylmethionine-8-amino-7-oxononanoate aminotransferase